LSSADRSQRDGTGRPERHLDAYGLAVQTDIDLPGLHSTPPSPRPYAVTLRAAPADELPSPLDEPRYLRNLQSYDDAAFAMLESPEGDVLFAYGRTTLFHLSADRATLRYAVGSPREAAWQRVLLDTVLWTVSLLDGFELLHAGAVIAEHGLIALVARTGGGKSTLAAEFLRRGATLFADDIVALQETADGLLAYPGPPLMNLPDALDPAQVGATVVAEFDDERWVAFERDSVGPTALGAVVLINRGAGETARCVSTEGTSLELLPHAITLPHLSDRARRRFEIFSSVSATVPVLSLHADAAVSASELADLIGHRLSAL
jgi:hypothetical protein